MSSLQLLECLGIQRGSQETLLPNVSCPQSIAFDSSLLGLWRKPFPDSELVCCWPCFISLDDPKVPCLLPFANCVIRHISRRGLPWSVDMTELIKDSSYFQSFFTHYNCLKTPFSCTSSLMTFSGKNQGWLGNCPVSHSFVNAGA